MLPPDLFLKELRQRGGAWTPARVQALFDEHGDKRSWTFAIEAIKFAIRAGVLATPPGPHGWSVRESETT